MNAAQILGKAASLRVSLRLDGNQIKIRGPRAARDSICAEVAAHKDEVVAYLGQYPVADGPYSPYAIPLSSEMVDGLMDELRATICTLAEVEMWPDNDRARVLKAVSCQPLSTVADDLAHFAELLRAAQAARAAAELIFRMYARASTSSVAKAAERADEAQRMGAR